MLQLAVITFVVVSNFLLAFMVLKKNRRSATHLLIAFLTLLFSVWTVANYLALLPGPEATRLFWVRFVMVITSPFGTSLFILSMVFPGSKLSIDKKLLYLVIFSTLLTAFISITPLVFSDLINLSGDNFTLVPGPGIALFGANMLVFTTLGLLQLVRKFLKASGVQKKQLTLVVAGMILCFSLMTATNFLAVVLFQSISLTVYGPVFTLFLTGSMTYAVMRHQFLDIRLAIAKSISFLY
jgi:hypothetical protein